MTKKKQYLTLIVSGLILLMLGFILNSFEIGGQLINLITINAGIILIVVAAFKFNYLGAGVTQDELTREISAKSLAFSWFLTFILLNILFWIDYFKIIVFNSQAIFAIVIFTMLLSAAVFKKLLYIKINNN